MYVTGETVNTYGQLGYINTPSAFNNRESSLSFSYSRDKPIRQWVVTGSPFSWLDASIFYLDIGRKDYGGGFKQSYKDKGFSLKITPGKFFGHTFALGANDMAGTGLLSSEYLTLSNNINRLNYTVGIGWGNYTGGISVNNPLTALNNSFKQRAFATKGKGGNFDFNNYFSGKESSIFFGAQYALSRKSSFLFELDPTTLSSAIPYPKKTNNFNFGYERRFNNLRIAASFIRGNNFSVQLSYLDNFLSFDPNPKRVVERTDNNLEIQKILEMNQIGLKKIEKDKKQAHYHVRQNSYYDHKEIDKRIYSIETLSKNTSEEVIVSQYINGMKVSTSKYKTTKTFSRNSEAIDKSSLPLVYKVNEKYPYFQNQNAFKLRNFIAAREGFYYGGIFAENNFTIVVDEDFYLLSNLKYSLIDNFDNLYIPPLDTYPAQVRSDIKQYFNNFDNGIVIGRLEANKFFSYNQKHFFRLSAGIFEEMFGGAGIEYLYSKEKSIFSYGFETFFLKKRDYSMRLEFMDYQNTISRANFILTEPQTNIKFKLSYGEYIAGDIGYTFTATKKFNNGVEYSAFFSRTNVPVSLYGEGSFDKGIRVSLPLPSIFSKKRAISKYEWHPLTKDPAALLIKSVELDEIVSRFR